MRLWQLFWNDEAGLILSSEAVLLGTLGVIGASVGLSAASRAVNDELTDLAFAFRSLDQSYEFSGTRGCAGWTAGSQFHQTPVKESLRELSEHVERENQKVREAEERRTQELRKLEAVEREEMMRQREAAEQRLREAQKKAMEAREKAEIEAARKAEDASKKAMEAPKKKTETPKKKTKKDA